MKHLLFISQSKLSQNLLRPVLVLTSKKMALRCCESVETIPWPKKGRSDFQLILIDWNAINEEKKLEDSLASLDQNRALSGAVRVLIHPLHAVIEKELFNKYGFTGYYIKPFLAKDLADIISNAMK